MVGWRTCRHLILSSVFEVFHFIYSFFISLHLFIAILDFCNVDLVKNLVISCHPSAAPIIFTKELESLTADEGDSVTLHCELSKPGVPLEWRKGQLGLCSCVKYEIGQTGKVATLVIHDVDPEDSGSYTCDTGDHQSTAELTVKGTLARNSCLQWRYLSWIKDFNIVTPIRNLKRLDLFITVNITH